MAGTSPGPSINRGPNTIHGQRPSQRHIVVATRSLGATSTLAGAMQKMHHTLYDSGRLKAGFSVYQLRQWQVGLDSGRCRLKCAWDDWSRSQGRSR